MSSLTRQPVPDGQFEIVLESENVGAWMAINNAFTFDWGAPASKGRRVQGGDRALSNKRAYWNGVLFQLGRFWAAEDHELMEGFTDIQFCLNNHVKLVLEPTEFQDDRIVWINIVRNTKVADPPVPLRDFRQWSKLGQLKDKDEKDFDRPRKLHHYLEPYPGGITLWHEDGYTIDAQPCDKLPGVRSHDKDHKHVNHTFRFSAPNHIQVLRIARSKAIHAAQWQQAKLNGGTQPQWNPWLEGSAADQENLAGKEAPPSVFSAHEINRIVVTDAKCGGQQIGKNPPQN